MQIEERWEDPLAAFKAAMSSVRARIWTALPGIIQQYNGDGTAHVQPALQGVIKLPTNANQNVNLPLLQHCPVQFPSGGGLYLTHPIETNDEALIIIASRCIDSWWQQGGVQPLLTYRMHDLSDGFCIPGISSKPNALANLSQTSIQLRTRNTTMMDISESQITLSVPLVSSQEITAKNIPLSMHVHGGVQSGGSTTGVPEA